MDDEDKDKIDIKELIKTIEFNPAVNDEDIANFESESGLKLPKEYKDFMKLTNGGEGPIGDFSYVQFWSLEELINLNEEYKVEELFPDTFIFGSDGGDEAYAFDTNSKPMKIVQFPFISMPEEIEVIANTFDEFIEYLYYKKDE